MQRRQRVSGQWANYSFFITRGRGQGLPFVSAGAVALSECAIIFSLPRKAGLPAELRCASRAGRFSVNSLAIRSLFLRSAPFITPIPHAWLQHLPKLGKKGHPKRASTNLTSCFPASYYTGRPVNQLWPSPPDLTGHKPELSTPLSLWLANLVLANTVDSSLTNIAGREFNIEERWEWTHYHPQS